MLKDKKNQIKIGIDARFFGPKQKGLGRYVQKLVEGLEETDTENQYVIFLRKDNWSDFNPRNHNFKKVLADFRWYSFGEQILMPFKVWQQKVDLIHYPHFNIPVFSLTPFVVTIHDLVLRRFPTRRASSLGPVRYFIKNLAYRFVILSAVKRARKIITVSSFTRHDILNHYKINPDKVEVIYEGGPQLNQQFKLPLQERIDSVKDFHLDKPYLLYVGNAYPHKNLERLISAFAKLISSKLTKDKYQDLRLVLVGGMDYFYHRLINTVNFSLPEVKDRIIFAGFVPDKDLAILYQRANLYIFPSLCEGFGLPPLEAMSFGCPVLSSKATCLPEILGKAALYFDPEDINQMTEKIHLVLKDHTMRSKLVDLGYTQVSRYSWMVMAKKSSQIYQRVVAQ